MLAAAPQLRQEVKWGNLCFQDNGENVAAIVLHKSHAHLQIFNGAALSARFPQLEGSGRGMRLLKWRLRQPVDAALVREVMLASLAVRATA